MFEKGKVYKVKVEPGPGKVGFGRATIVERLGEKLCIQLKTSREANKPLAKGTRIWFVNDSPENVFNGLWACTVIGAQIVAGKTAMVTSAPRLEAYLQRRRTPRAAIDAPVTIFGDGDEDHFSLRSLDISSSGIAVVTPGSMPAFLEVGNIIRLTLESPKGLIITMARVIRVDSNWLANRTVMGLEFVEMNDDSSDALSNLLELLGLHAVVAEPGEAGKSKLFGWKGGQRGERDDKTFVKGSMADVEENIPDNVDQN